MTIIYEINPPKIPRGSSPSDDEAETLLSEMGRRIGGISESVDGIHITESVLGTSRLSPVTTARIIGRMYPDLRITTSMRVVDKDAGAVMRYVDDAVTAGIYGILVLKGDPSQYNPTDSGLVPSSIVNDLRKKNYAKKIKLFLSIPSNPDFKKIKKKIDAEPAGFITQVVHSAGQISRICKELRPRFRVIPIVLLPSEKNKRSAEFLNLDWSGYKDRVGEFVGEVRAAAGEVLITSPNDFDLARRTLGSLR